MFNFTQISLNKLNNLSTTNRSKRTLTTMLFNTLILLAVQAALSTGQLATVYSNCRTVRLLDVLLLRWFFLMLYLFIRQIPSPWLSMTDLTFMNKASPTYWKLMVSKPHSLCTFLRFIIPLPCLFLFFPSNGNNCLLSLTSQSHQVN